MKTNVFFFIVALFGSLFFLYSCREIPIDTSRFDFQIEFLSTPPKRILVGDSVEIVFKINRNINLELPEVRYYLAYTTTGGAQLFSQNRIEVLKQNNNIITNLDSFKVTYVALDTGVHEISFIVSTNFNGKTSVQKIKINADVFLYDLQYINESEEGYNPFRSKTSPSVKDTSNSQIFSNDLNNEEGGTGSFVNEKTPMAIYLKPSKDPYTIIFNTTNTSQIDNNIVINNTNNALVSKNKEYTISGGWTKFFVTLSDYMAKQADNNGVGNFDVPVTISHKGRSVKTSVSVRQVTEPIDLVITSIVDTTEGEEYTGNNSVSMHSKKVLAITIENRTKSPATNTYVAFKQNNFTVKNNTLSPFFKNGAFYFSLGQNESKIFYLSVNSIGFDSLKIYAFNDREVTIQKEQRILQQAYSINGYQPAVLPIANIRPTSRKEKVRETLCPSGGGKIVDYDVYLTELSFTGITANSTKQVNIYLLSTNELIYAKKNVDQFANFGLVNQNMYIGVEHDDRACSGNSTYTQIDVRSSIGVKDNYGNNLVVK